MENIAEKRQKKESDPSLNFLFRAHGPLLSLVTKNVRGFKQLLFTSVSALKTKSALFDARNTIEVAFGKSEHMMLWKSAT